MRKLPQYVATRDRAVVGRRVTVRCGVPPSAEFCAVANVGCAGYSISAANKKPGWFFIEQVDQPTSTNWFGKPVGTVRHVARFQDEECNHRWLCGQCHLLVTPELG